MCVWGGGVLCKRSTPSTYLFTTDPISVLCLCAGMMYTHTNIRPGGSGGASHPDLWLRYPPTDDNSP